MNKLITNVTYKIRNTRVLKLLKYVRPLAGFDVTEQYRVPGFIFLKITAITVCSVLVVF